MTTSRRQFTALAGAAALATTLAVPAAWAQKGEVKIAPDRQQDRSAGGLRQADHHRLQPGPGVRHQRHP